MSRPPLPLVDAPFAATGWTAAGGVGREPPPPKNPENMAPPAGSGQACDRHALMRGAHHAAPDFHRQAAAGHMFGRRSVIVAEPYAGHKVRGVADEPGVAEILAGAGLSGGGPAGQARALRGADGERLGHHRVHHRDVTRFDDAAELRRAARIEHLAVAGDDLVDHARHQRVAAIGEGRVGADKFEHRDFRGAERDRGVRLELRARCRGDRPCGPRPSA